MGSKQIERRKWGRVDKQAEEKERKRKDRKDPEAAKSFNVKFHRPPSSSHSAVESAPCDLSIAAASASIHRRTRSYTIGGVGKEKR